jgi:hypothetical protein
MDSELLARSFASSGWARRTNTRFRAVSVAALKSGAERRIGPYDFACALETPERSAELGQQLAAAGAGVDAWLLGPWLGVHTNLAERLTRAAGIPVGETASAPGGVAGARFALRRSALFERAGIEHQVRSVRAVANASGRPVVTLDDGTEITARAVVLAVGGVVGGGIALGAPGAAKALVASLDAPVEVLLGSHGDDGAGWLNGPNFERLGLRALESLGILVNESSAVATDFPLFVAGDALARQPKTAIAALASGIEAGLRAVRAV